jgi:CheY-like chemotaxis protein/two-component sensor histidine kinase
LRFENLDLIKMLQTQKEIAESASVAKSKFLAAASHDLRQPLHALSLFSSALSERIKYPEVRAIVDNIELSVAALEDLFNALLDISRLDAGIILPKLQHFRIKGLAERLIAEFATQAQRKGLNFQIDGPDAIAYTDPTLLETMLRNLISNAIRFTAHGSVKVVWMIEGAQLLIEVLDTGIGIPVEDREKIFIEFSQLDNTERDRNKGMGLGLAIVKRLAILLQCTIHLQSSVGFGSVFRLSIPKGDNSLIVNDSRSLKQLIENEPRLLVLVIDDEVPIREAMTALLGNWGHDVVAAGSLANALQVIKRTPDAIIADYRLREGETGIEAIHRIHEIWGSDIPSLIVTGDTAPELLLEAQSSGIAFMHKPVYPAKLRAFLRSVSRHSRSPH